MTKITYEKLREFLANSEKYPKCKKYKRVPLIHEGFPGTFNLSFTEYDMLREFGGYSNFSHNLVYSSIQSCIRPQDILENLKEGKDMWKYLGVFELSDIAGQIFLSEKKDIEEVHGFQIEKLIEILEKLGLDKNKIYPSYQKGGKISEITKGKYSFNFEIPEDSFTKNKFIELGVPKENLIPDKTRDTLLSLHLHMKTPWGYRNEINYNLGSKENPRFLDIATVEYFKWFPKYSLNEESSKNIYGLEDFPHTASVGGIGVERLFMTISGLKKIQDVDYIKKFYDLFRNLYPELTEEQRTKAGEIIRSLHRLYSDIKEIKLNSLGNNRKNKIKWFLQILSENIEQFDKDKLKMLLELHSKVQPWHKNLQKGIKPTIERIEINYKNKAKV